jgi:hypothetical protein
VTGPKFTPAPREWEGRRRSQNPFGRWCLAVLDFDGYTVGSWNVNLLTKMRPISSREQAV